MAMLEGVEDLTLERLNTITQAWVEQDYHRNVHTEIATTPLKRYLDAPNVGRRCPDAVPPPRGVARRLRPLGPEVDPHSGQGLWPLYPLDKVANACGERRRLTSVSEPESIPVAATALPPLLHKLLAEYAATGLPPAYLPKDDDPESNA